MSAPAPSAILVGYDGSLDAQRALAWAAQHAARSGRELRLLSAVPHALLGRHREELHQAVHTILDGASARVREQHPGLAVQTLMAETSPAEALLDHAHDTAMLVVGRRGHGAVADALLGSVSHRVAAHAPCPVVVVPPGGPVSPSATVVVGVAEASDAPVLDFAVTYAAESGGDVLAVHAWSLPVSGFAPELAMPLLTDAREMLAARDAVLGNAVDAARGRFPGARIEPSTVEGPTGRVLADASAEAAMLVVGAHRHRGPFPLRVGPTAHYVLRHATCPVTVVPVPGR
ncbi:universal stress protein [Yinghuangia seranimata]|uniref:universal stress protein n=1 Tax=Yinghuangia seranimata TaxID=408067 RepID=UPI00248CBA40|nr:universal stress protein [Yinghuangia seranimata]MDI2125465.1 universal stress protein [Yinghuangia seranimata]